MRRTSLLRSTLLLFAVLLWACPSERTVRSAPDAAAPARQTPAAAAEDVAECPKVRAQIITNPKGVAPELRLAGSAPGRKGRPVAILVATAEELASGTSFPAALVDELVQRQLNVVEAIGLREGDGGRADLLAVRSMALRGTCEADPTRVAIVATPKTGASVLEIATSTQAEHRPAAIVFLSGGEYTESRAKFDAHRADLETIPILFVYADRDAAWSTRFQAEPTSPLWLFRRGSGDAHGLGLLSGPKDTADDIAVFLEGFLQ